MRIGGKRAKRIFMITALLTLLAAITAFPGARAQYGERPTRQTTPEERNFEQRVLQIFKDSCPPGPAGWEAWSERSEEVPADIPLDLDPYPYEVVYFISWNDPGAKAADFSTLQARYEELMEASYAAGGEGDWKKSDALMEEAMGIFLIMMDDSTAASGRSALNIEIHANCESGPWVQPEEEIDAINGNRAFRREGTTYVLLGPSWELRDYSSSYQPNTNYQLVALRRPGMDRLQIQSILVEVFGSEENAAQYLRNVNWQALQSLLE